MGNLLGGVFGGKSPKKSQQPMQQVTQTSTTVSKASLSKRPSLTEIIPICPDGKPVEFTWNHGGSTVVLTGTFDGWSQSIQMAKDLDIWRKTILLDPKQTYEFKYVVDGVWRCSMDWDTNKDTSGNINNIIRSSI